jgi:hypothetical protein
VWSALPVSAIPTGRHPILERWLHDAPVIHPWQVALERGDATGALAVMETVLAAIEAAGPERIARKRRSFARNALSTHVSGLRVELIAAYLLARAGRSFDFGGDGQPDLLCRVGSTEMWLELTTRTRDDASLLANACDSDPRARSF